MNILHHKSWHVRTKANIERVRRDEEKAAEEEKEKQRKIALAEQDARTDLLRDRVKRKSGHELEGTDEKIPRLETDTHSVAVTASSSKTTDIYTSTGHFNFFKDAEDGLKKYGKNKDHEEEKRAEKEKWEKDIGLLTYLGQGSVEMQETAPWYLTKKDKEKEREEKEVNVNDRKMKDHLDPLVQMSSYVEKKRRKDKHKDKHKDKRREKHKEKSHKHKHKKKEKEKQHEKKKKHSSSTRSIQELRAERLRREQEERKKAEALLLGKQGQGQCQGHDSDNSEEPVNERKRKYNSVFNPEFSKKQKTSHSYDYY